MQAAYISFRDECTMKKNSILKCLKHKLSFVSHGFQLHQHLKKKRRRVKWFLFIDLVPDEDISSEFLVTISPT